MAFGPSSLPQGPGGWEGGRNFLGMKEQTEEDLKSVRG